MTAPAPAPDFALAEEDRQRAELYNFLGLMLSAPPSDALLKQTAALEGGDTPLGLAITGLARVAARSSAAQVEREYNALFIGLGRGELLPYASFYLTGFLNEKPLARLRADMARLGLRRAANVFEPEDNIASLLEMMAGLIDGRFGKPASLEQQKQFYNTHLAPWAGHFFDDLKGAKNSVLFASVAEVARIFTEIEREGFRMSAA